MSMITKRFHSVPISTIALTIVTLTSTYILTKQISKYSLAGFLRLLWEGDHLPPEIREAFETLNDLEERGIPNQGRKLDKIDCTIQLAKLNSVDNDDEEEEEDYTVTNNATADANSNATTNSTSTTRPSSASSASSTTTTSSSSSRRRHYIVSQTPQITRELSSLSYNLDKLAAKVDEVSSYGDMDVKRRKKELSTTLVKMMERVDGFIAECGVVVPPS